MLGAFYPTAAKTATELTTFDNHAERTIGCESFFASSSRAAHLRLPVDAEDEAVEDDEVRAFLETVNDAAYADMLARFDEAIERGLWTPRRNSVHSDIERLRTPSEESRA